METSRQIDENYTEEILLPKDADGNTIEFPEGIPSPPAPTPAPKRVRRRKMTAEIYARYCNRCALAFGEVAAEFDPSDREVELMLTQLHQIIALSNVTHGRRTS